MSARGGARAHAHRARVRARDVRARGGRGDTCTRDDVRDDVRDDAHEHRSNHNMRLDVP